MKVMKVKKALGIAMTTAMVFTMAMPAFASSGVVQDTRGGTASQTGDTQINVNADVHNEIKDGKNDNHFNPDINTNQENRDAATKQLGATLTIHGVPESGDKDHVFQAYQIFRGDISNTLNGKTLEGNERVLSNVEWGANFDETKATDFYDELAKMGIKARQNNNDGTFTEIPVDSARTFAEALSLMENDSAKLIDISRMLDKYLKGNPIGTLEKGSKDGATDAGIDTYTYTIKDLPAGYYFVKDANETQDDILNGNYTRIILKLVGDSVVNAKSDTVKSEKKVQEDTKYQQDDGYDTAYNDSNDAEIGEVVNYEFLAPIIEPSEIEKFVNDYHYIFHDKMSEGLTFLFEETYLEKAYDVTVEIYGKNDNLVGFNKNNKKATLVKGTDFTVTKNPADGDTFDVDITLYNKAEGKFAGGATNLEKNDVVVVRFSARVNDKAVIGGAGNVNEMKLEYSNNPNGGGTGETPKDEVVTFVYELDVNKIDGADKKALDDAYFVFYKIVDGKKVYANIDEENNFKLIGWTSEELPEVDQATLDRLNNNWNDAAKKEFEEIFESKNISVLVSKDGKFSISGLDDDTYYLQEVKAPQGYNLLKEVIKVVITADTKNGQNLQSPFSLGKLERTFDLESNQNPEVAPGNTETGEVEGTIANNRGTVLPSTGGMGTTLFYAIGGVLLVGAAVLLVTRKRVEA